MKAALAVMLLALVPLSSLRMVCVTAHDLIAKTTADQTASADDADECERVCKRHPAAEAPRPPASGVECVLVADPSCDILSAGASGVLPAAPAIPREERLTVIAAIARDSYTSPSSALLTPPPKAHA